MENLNLKEMPLYFLLKNYVLLVILLGFASCSKEIVPGNERDTGSSLKNQKISVTVKSGSSIQTAVDAAAANTIIYIEPGIYEEAIVINKPGMQLIGIKGNTKVVIQNPGELENGITVRSEGDGFVLKNVTIKDFEDNGVFMIRADNYLLEDVTAINNTEYGLYPVFCNNGIIRNCTATGSTDTGIYVGQSTNISLSYNVAYGNVSGYEIENCSNVTASFNEAYNNTAGILIFLLPGLRVKTSSDIVISHNKIYNNNLDNFSTPEGGLEFFIPKGMGILLLGADNATIEYNLVRDNNFVGIATVSTLLLGALNGAPPEAFADIEPNPDGARIIHNVLQGNGSEAPAGLPLPAADLLWDGSGNDNCWKSNVFTTSYPASLPICN
jgi:parallel beta-helix repeat protein